MGQFLDQGTDAEAMALELVGSNALRAVLRYNFGPDVARSKRKPTATLSPSMATHPSATTPNGQRSPMPPEDNLVVTVEYVLSGRRDELRRTLAPFGRNEGYDRLLTLPDGRFRH